MTTPHKEPLIQAPEVLEGIHPGNMTLRDYFAAKAMQGFASDCGATWKNGCAGMAEFAYKWADAMLKARHEDQRSNHGRD